MTSDGRAGWDLQILSRAEVMCLLSKELILKACGGFGWSHLVKFQCYTHRLSHVRLFYKLNRKNIFPYSWPVRKMWSRDTVCTSGKPGRQVEGAVWCEPHFIFLKTFLSWQEHLNRSSQVPLAHWDGFINSSPSHSQAEWQILSVPAE